MGARFSRVSANSVYFWRRQLGGETRDASGGFGVIVVKGGLCRRAWGQEEARVGMRHVALVFFELHVGSDVGAQRPDGVGERGGAESGMKFFGDGAAANEFATLKD